MAVRVAVNHVNSDPCDAAATVPLVLLPVRLETRFSDDGQTLRVRIFPDDVHVDQLDEGLSNDEVAAGTAYWRSVWMGGAGAETAAWQALLHAIGPNRAGWVAHALTPLNLSARPTTPGASQPEPDLPPTLPPHSHAPLARCMPDRFVVVADQPAGRSIGVGNPIVADPVVSLPRGDVAPDILKKKLNGLRLAAEMKWAIDYDEAERVGMAVSVRLNSPGAAVDTLLAFGVRSSIDAAAGAQQLERLLTAHRFTRGAAFLRQGTPTNNTETDRSAWQRHLEPAPVSTTVPSSPLPPDANASRTAAALGIDARVTASLDRAESRDHGAAGAANTALWAPSWGTFFQRVTISTGTGPTIDDAKREALRDLFQDYVRGRGPLPAIRLGDQPYGILPVSSVDRRWQPDQTDPIEAGLIGLLRRIGLFWRMSLGNVPKVMEGQLDAALLNVLSSSPTMVGLRVRSVASKTSCSIAPLIPGIQDVLPGTLQENNFALQDTVDRLIWQTLGVDPDRVGIKGALGSTTRPLGLPLVDPSDPDFIRALLAGTSRAINSVLQALLEIAEDAENNAVKAASPKQLSHALIERAGEMTGDLRQQLGELATAAVEGSARPEALHGMANRLEQVVAPAGPSLLVQYQPVSAVRGSLAEVALQPGLQQNAASTLAMQALSAWFRASARYADFHAALIELAQATVDDRRLLVAEALDLASHRFDAWTTALVSRRLDVLRGVQPTGAVVGAYGWVEQLRPGSGLQRDGGFVHAPSLIHSATAGVLRSAYLTHNPDASGSGAFTMDLSSERVRRALDVLEGMRRGQSLAALLGYRIERSLHERKLDRYILSLRALAPLVSGKLSDRSDAPPPAAQEAISANSVVDGLRLLELRHTIDLRAELDKLPQNNTYLTAADWPKMTQSEWDDIKAALDAAAADHDAVADLMLAESAHQLVQGNTARAAAALDAAAAGDAPPIDAHVVDTPLRGVAFTHRVLLLLPETAPAAGGWAQTTPRAAAEPRLEAWAESRLGPAADTILHIASDGSRTTLADAGLSALDVIYDARERSMLERRIRVALPALSGVPLLDKRDATWPASLRTFAETAEFAAAIGRLLVSAQPALAPAFARPNDQPVRRVADIGELETRVLGARATFAGVAAQLDALLAPTNPDPSALFKLLVALADFGIPSAVEAGPNSVQLAHSAQAEAIRRLAAVDALLGGSAAFNAATGIAAGSALFGDGFWMLPLIEPDASPDLFADAAGWLDPGNGHIRRFIRDVASVRPGMARLAETLLYADALGVGRSLRVVQLAAPGTAGATRWIALPFDLTQPLSDGPMTSIVLDAPNTFGSSDRACGLVFDEWSEVSPRRAAPALAQTKPIEPMTTTGLAINANLASTRAPQAILVAVSPDGQRWTTDALADTLLETLELAKLRAVTLESVVLAGRILPALEEPSASLQGEKTLDIKQLVMRADAAYLPYIKD